MAKKSPAAFKVLSDRAAIEQVAHILDAMHHALTIADQEAGDTQKVGYWNVLFEAATSHAHYLLTGTGLITLHLAPAGAGARAQIGGGAVHG